MPRVCVPVNGSVSTWFTGRSPARRRARRNHRSAGRQHGSCSAVFAGSKGAERDKRAAPGPTAGNAVSYIHKLEGEEKACILGSEQGTSSECLVKLWQAPDVGSKFMWCLGFRTHPCGVLRV
ncbi:unnamed protein product [Lepidochelys kempii]